MLMGLRDMQILRHIIAPLSTPGLVVVGIYAFIGAYAQQFLFAITFNSKKEYMPIPAGLYEFIGYQTVKWNEMMAASSCRYCTCFNCISLSSKIYS